MRLLRCSRNDECLLCKRFILSDVLWHAINISTRKVNRYSNLSVNHVTTDDTEKDDRIETPLAKR